MTTALQHSLNHPVTPLGTAARVDARPPVACDRGGRTRLCTLHCVVGCSFLISVLRLGIRFIPLPAFGSNRHAASETARSGHKGNRLSRPGKD